MGLNIKNHETERLVRALVAATGETVTGAITVAVRERLERVEQQTELIAAERVNRMREIAQDSAPRWVEPYRSADHGELIYDPLGLPR